MVVFSDGAPIHNMGRLGTIKCYNWEKKCYGRKGITIFAPSKLYDHFNGRVEKVHFQVLDCTTLEQSQNCKKHFYIRNTRSDVYRRFQENPLTFDTQNACLKRPCAGDIYGENTNQKLFQPE